MQLSLPVESEDEGNGENFMFSSVSVGAAEETGRVQPVKGAAYGEWWRFFSSSEKYYPSLDGLKGKRYIIKSERLRLSSAGICPDGTAGGFAYRFRAMRKRLRMQAFPHCISIKLFQTEEEKATMHMDIIIHRPA